MYTSPTPLLRVELDERVLTLTLNRPDHRNALAPEMTEALGDALAWASDAADVGAVMLTGAGKAFCAGGDVKAMGKRAEGPPETHESAFRALQRRHQRIAGALTKLRKPTLAALPGPAAGAGMAIALACDMRMAADTAFLATGYARIGFSGDYGIAWLLTRTVGPARARELMLTCERVGADHALALGLVNWVVPADEMQERARARAVDLANGPTVAYAYIKDNLDEALDIDHATAIDREADRLLKTRGTQDHREAVRAFAEKRDPQFEGR